MSEEFSEIRHKLKAGDGPITVTPVLNAEKINSIIFRQQNDPKDPEDFQTEAYSINDLPTIVERAKALDLMDQVAKALAGKAEVPGARELFDLDSLHQTSMFDQEP